MFHAPVFVLCLVADTSSFQKKEKTCLWVSLPTSRIPELLRQGRYDGAFCLDSYNYRAQLKTRLYEHDEWASWGDSNAPKSRYCGGNALEKLHFKNKESGGWPGDMKFFPENAGSFYVPLGERARMKRYFMPERCLYCVDKLNVLGDISLGDNYTNTASSPPGQQLRDTAHPKEPRGLERRPGEGGICSRGC